MRTGLSPEAELALLLSTPTLDEEREVPRLRGLLDEPLNWTLVLGMLAAHRTTGVAWPVIVDHVIADRRTARPTYFFRGIEATYTGQRVLAEEQIRYDAELTGAFDAEEVRCAFLKGGAVALMAYPHLGMRQFYDNDLLVERDAMPRVGALLRRLGYVQGSWDYRTRTVRPASRNDIVFMGVTSHQTFPYMKPTPESAVLACHRIDVHVSVDLMTSNRTDEIVASMLNQRVSIGEPPLWGLAPTDAVVFGCIHHYKEAVYRDEVLRSKDLVLYKLVDLLALLEHRDRPVGFARLVARAQEWGQQEAVYFCLVHLDALFPGRVPPEALHALRPASVEYLDEVRDGNGVVHRWRDPVAERFFNPRRAQEIADVVEGTVAR